MKTGRPSIYSEDLAIDFCSRLVDGTSVRSVCKQEDMPCSSTIFKWLAEIPEFSERYAQAKEMAVEALAEELFEIADDGSNDWMERSGKDGENIGWAINGEHIQRSKLRVDVRKFYMAKIKPNKYGDIKTLNHNMDDSIAERILRARSRIDGE